MRDDFADLTMSRLPETTGTEEVVGRFLWILILISSDCSNWPRKWDVQRSCKTMKEPFIRSVKFRDFSSWVTNVLI